MIRDMSLIGLMCPYQHFLSLSCCENKVYAVISSSTACFMRRTCSETTLESRNVAIGFIGYR